MRHESVASEPLECGQSVANKLPVHVCVRHSSVNFWNSRWSVMAVDINLMTETHIGQR